MTRGIAIAGHGLLVAFAVLSLLGGAIAAHAVSIKIAQLVLLAGCVTSMIVLVRRSDRGRLLVMIFNGLLLFFAISCMAGLLYYEARYGGQPLFWGTVAIAVFLIPPIASILALKRRRADIAV